MALITKTYTFTAGQLIIAAEHNANFDTIYTDYNGGITNANISASAAIVDTKLDTISTAGKVSGAALASLGSVPSGGGILPGANGGTANGFFAVTGPTTSLKTFTFPNASATVLTSNSAVTVAQGGTGATTLTGLVVGNGTSAFTTVTAPSGTVVGTSDTQELTNKTLNASVGKGTWTASGTWTLPAITLGGDVTFSENVALVLDPALSADGKYCGVTESVTAGETIAFGDLVYLKAADSRYWLTDADADATAGAVKVAMAVSSGTAGNSMTVLHYGKVRADANFPALTVGAPVYISTTAGDIQVAQPSGTDDVIRIVGYALTTDEILFNPSDDYVTHV